MDIKKYRKKHGIRQDQFWNPVGVNQSAGSRYECGRRIPAPVALLLDLTYGDRRRREKILAALDAARYGLGA